MKIAYMGVKGLPSKSGTERVIEAIVKRLVGKFDITVYCDSDYTLPDAHYEGVKLIRIHTFTGRHLKPILLGIFSALHAVFLGDYDIIHMNGVENCFILPLLRLRYRVISTSHGTPGRMPISKWSRTERFFMQLAEYPFLYLSNCATAISVMDADYLYDRYKKNVSYIPNGVDYDIQTDHEAALRFVDNLGLLPKEFLLFIAGRIIKRKGCHLFLEAVNKLNMDIPVVVIGDMEQTPEYAQRLRELAADKQVIFIPPIADKSLVYEILNLCKLFVFPSTAEGMSIMLLEAASLGVPMVCSDIPENRIILGEYVTYFRSDDHIDLAEKIHWALNTPHELSRLAQTLKNSVRSNYSWDSVASRYEALYLQCSRAKSELDLDANIHVAS
jgi:glycosyltransferase involved in cell wall biosynthesis